MVVLNLHVSVLAGCFPNPPKLIILGSNHQKIYFPISLFLDIFFKHADTPEELKAKEEKESSDPTTGEKTRRSN